MEEVAIGWWGLGASLFLVGVAMGVSLGRRLGLERELLVAAGRVGVDPVAGRKHFYNLGLALGGHHGSRGCGHRPAP